jgi:hypothetical protein
MRFLHSTCMPCSDTCERFQSTLLLHGASPDEAVSTRGSIAIQCKSSCQFGSKLVFLIKQSPKNFLQFIAPDGNDPRIIPVEVTG